MESIPNYDRSLEPDDDDCDDAAERLVEKYSRCQYCKGPNDSLEIESVKTDGARYKGHEISWLVVGVECRRCGKEYEITDAPDLEGGD